ncbi:MAG TPA: hypothetical protein VF427_12055 [Noviherbaspirillum sp.]
MKSFSVILALCTSLVFFENHLDHLSKAPVGEVEAFWQHFNDTIEKGGGMPEAGNLHLEKRKVGAFQANS